MTTPTQLLSDSKQRVAWKYAYTDWNRLLIEHKDYPLQLTGILEEVAMNALQAQAEEYEKEHDKQMSELTDFANRAYMSQLKGKDEEILKLKSELSQVREEKEKLWTLWEILIYS